MADRDNVVIARLLANSRQIEQRIAQLDERIVALDRQLSVNERILETVEIEERYYDDLFSDDEYEREDYPSSDDSTEYSDDETVVYYDARSDDGYGSDMSDASTVVVMDEWEDPYKTPMRGYQLYYPAHLDEGFEILENL